MLSSTFDMDYLCKDGYTRLLYNFDDFLNKLTLWISSNNLTRGKASNSLGVSTSLFRYWYNGGTIKISTYNKIEKNLIFNNLL